MDEKLKVILADQGGSEPGVVHHDFCARITSHIKRILSSIDGYVSFINGIT